MNSKLFHTLIVVGASITGSIGVVVVPAAVVTLAGCGDDDRAVGQIDAGIVGTADAHITYDSYGIAGVDFAELVDAGNPDGGPTEDGGGG